MFKKLSILMLLAVAMGAKAEDEAVSRRKDKCRTFCSVSAATLNVSGQSTLNNLTVRNILNLAGVNLNNLLGISGTAGINDGTGAVGLVDADGAQTNAGGAFGLGLTTFANYYSMSTTDIIAGDAVPLEEEGAVSASGIARSGSANTTFVLSSVGTYEITFYGSFRAVAGNFGQIALFSSNDGGANFNPVQQAVAGTLYNFAASTNLLAQVSITALLTTTVANTLIQLQNTTGNNITPFIDTSGTTLNSPSFALVIKRVA